MADLPPYGNMDCFYRVGIPEIDRLQAGCSTNTRTVECAVEGCTSTIKVDLDVDMQPEVYPYTQAKGICALKAGGLFATEDNVQVFDTTQLWDN